jgi:hypothetical protein
VILLNKKFKLVILFILVVIGITYYLQYNSLAKTRKELGLEYYKAVSHIDSKLKDYEKTFEEKFYNLNNEDIKHYSTLLGEYNVIQDILPNSNVYKDIFTSLKESLSELKGINDLHIGTKAKIRSKILKDLHMLTDIYGLMIKEYDGSNEKYYKKINNKNSELNFQIRDYVNEWYDNYNKGIKFHFKTIDSILRNNEKIRDIAWASDKSVVLLMKADSKTYKAYLWRVGEENGRFITSVSLNNYGFSWSPNNRYF